MARTSFEDLRVYRHAEELADLVWAMAIRWRAFARDTVGKQLVRATDSIGANIAEGSGRGTPADNKRFAQIARGSLYETKHWLRRAYCRKLIPSQQVEALRKLTDRLGPELNAYITSIARTAKPLGNAITDDQQPRTNNQ